jgi:hypothetical protein
MRVTLAAAMAANNQLTARSNVLLQSIDMHIAKSGAYLS